MGLIMVVVGLLLLTFAYFQIRGGAVQKEIARFVPDLAAGGGSAASIAAFQDRCEAVFARHNVTDPKKKLALKNYARIIAKRDITPEQNELLIDLVKQRRL